MNLQLFIMFMLISLVAIFIFWLFYRRADTTTKQAQKHLLTQLKDQSLVDQKRQEYEKQLSSLLLKTKTNNAASIPLLTGLFIIPVSFILYINWGNPQAISQIQQQMTQTQNQAPQMSMQEAIAQLEVKLAANPNDVDGQMLYARSQFSVQNFDKAVQAYRKADELAPNQPVILTELAEAIARFNNNSSFLGEPEGLLQKAVDIDPTNQKALWLLGMTYYERQNYTKTNELWTRLSSLMNNEQAKATLQQQLDDVRAQINASEQIEGEDSTNNNALINIRVTIEPSLQQQFNTKNALLYIYSKATNGMPMPIAVIRQNVNKNTIQQPLNLTLSDQNNLQPQRKLSDFDQVIIGARISFSGNAMAQPGDLQSDEVSINLNSTDVIDLNINQVKK